MCTTRVSKSEINDVTNKLLLLKSENGNFNDSSLDVIRKIKKNYDNNQTFIKRSHVLNNLSRHRYSKDRNNKYYFRTYM